MESYSEWVERGRDAAAEGRLDVAIAAYRAATKLRPGRATAHLELARVLREAGLIEAARQSFARAAEAGAGRDKGDEAAAGLAGLPPAPARRENFRVGQRLRSERQRTFEVLDVRTGGFGVVYIVRTVGGTGPRRALKTFNAGYLWSDDDRQRFEREAATWIGLRPHPHVVTASSVEPIEGFPCLDLEYVGGGDLSARLAAGPLGLDEAVRLAFQFCDGMSHAYEESGLVHRDVKPANCLLTEDGDLKVTDFGLARAFGRAAEEHWVGPPSEAAALLTSVIGTPAFMAPEQFRPGERLDSRADVYAFGVMLRQMVTGLPPGAGTGRPVRWWSRSRSDRLTRLVRHCTEPRREDRPATFADVREELARIGAPPARAAATPMTAAMLVERAVGQRHLGLHREALATVEEGLRIAGDNRVMRGHLWQVRGLAQTDLHQHAAALASHERSTELNPDEFSAWECKAATLSRLHRYEEALACSDRAVELRPDEGYGQRGRASSLLGLRRYDEAVRAAEEAVERLPHDPQALHLLGILLRRLGRTDEAVPILDRLLGVAPRHALGWILKAEVVADLGRTDEALVCAARAAEIAPDNPPALFNRGLLLERLERHDEALACYDRAVGIDPGHADAWNGRGTALRALGRLDEALASSARALELAPTDSTIWNHKGVTLERLKRYEEALACYDKMAEFDPEDGWAWFNRGVTLHKLDRLPEAVESLDRAVRLAPGNAKIASSRDHAARDLNR